MTDGVARALPSYRATETMPELLPCAQGDDGIAILDCLEKSVHQRDQ
jgi:hypothetical protein